MLQITPVFRNMGVCKNPGPQCRPETVGLLFSRHPQKQETPKLWVETAECSSHEDQLPSCLTSTPHPFKGTLSLPFKGPPIYTLSPNSEPRTLRRQTRPGQGPPGEVIDRSIDIHTYIYIYKDMCVWVKLPETLPISSRCQYHVEVYLRYLI